MTDLAGKISIELCRAGGSFRVQVQSSRPVSASRVFVGKGVAATATALPALFSICANAQASACANACEAAMGIEAHKDVASLRQLLVDAETVKEHLWRLLLDWPLFLAGAPDRSAVVRAMAAFTRLRGALTLGGNPFTPGASGTESDFSAATACLDEFAAVTSKHVLGMPIDEWLRRAETPHGFLTWARGSETPAARLVGEIEARGWADVGRSAVPALPMLTATQFEGLLGGAAADAFVGAPRWRQGAAETSPFCRNSSHAAVAELVDRFGNGLLPRLAAQLVELAMLQARMGVRLRHAYPEMSVSSRSVGTGVGIAQVQAARGLLVHRVALEEDRIQGYRILAPTEWNFHPEGAAAAGLANFQRLDDDSLRRLAGLFVTAVDPCVEYDVILR